jgi:RNA 2',3'-cyclic 3'-phosphodiesterase
MSERALRLFAALELPREAIARLAALPFDEETWRRVPPESLHVTLAFLGATDPGAVPELSAALESVDGVAPRLALGGALLHPPRRARALAVALEDPHGTLAALQRDVSDGLAATGAYAPERRAFRAHVTVGRLRPRVRAPRRLDLAVAPLAFAGTAVTLFSSRTSPHGARYEPLVSIRLPAGRTDD